MNSTIQTGQLSLKVTACSMKPTFKTRKISPQGLQRIDPDLYLLCPQCFPEPVRWWDFCMAPDRMRGEKKSQQRNLVSLQIELKLEHQLLSLEIGKINHEGLIYKKFSVQPSHQMLFVTHPLSQIDSNVWIFLYSASSRTHLSVLKLWHPYNIKFPLQN